MIGGVCITSNIYAQEIIVANKDIDSILFGRTGPNLEQRLNPIFIINGLVIRDSVRIENFRKNYLSTVDKVKYLNEFQTLDKYGIKHKDGVLLIRTKKKKIIEL